MESFIIICNKYISYHNQEAFISNTFKIEVVRKDSEARFILFIAPLPEYLSLPFIRYRVSLGLLTNADTTKFMREMNGESNENTRDDKK